MKKRPAKRKPQPKPPKPSVVSEPKILRRTDHWQIKQELHIVSLLFKEAKKHKRSRGLLESIARDLYDLFIQPILTLERRYRKETYDRSPDIDPIEARQKVLSKLIKALQKVT